MSRVQYFYRGTLIALIALTATAFFPNVTAHAQGWPELPTASTVVEEGSADAALIIGIEDYLLAPDVPGAVDNARDWYIFFTRHRKIPVKNVVLLRDHEGALETIEAEAAAVAKKTSEGGTLWVVFIGHGAPSKDGSDGVLVGVDAQQTATSLYARSLPQKTLVGILEQGKQAHTILLLDACFSGRTGDGSPIAPSLQPLIPVRDTGSTVTVLSAGKNNEFAGPLPGAQRPAFSYLILGAIQGWGDANADQVVTAEEAVYYARDVLQTVVKDRAQTPQLRGPDAGFALSRSGAARGPDLVAMVLGGAESKNKKIRERVIEEKPKVIEPSPTKGMVEVPAGEFIMGSNDKKAEEPRQKVYLDAFYIDKNEVTAAQYDQCLRGGGCTKPTKKGSDCTWGKRGKERHPMNCVNWQQAHGYCRWAGRRLPTEAEWEKAARGAHGQTYPWPGNHSSCQFAISDEGGDGCGRDSTWPVGSRPAGASPYGALDMVGNVWEWTADWSGHYSASRRRNPRGPASGSKKIRRGGGFDDDPGKFNASSRDARNPSRAADDIGFRCAR